MTTKIKNIITKVKEGIYASLGVFAICLLFGIYENQKYIQPQRDGKQDEAIQRVDLKQIATINETKEKFSNVDRYIETRDNTYVITLNKILVELAKIENKLNMNFDYSIFKKKETNYLTTDTLTVTEK